MVLYPDQEDEAEVSVGQNEFTVSPHHCHTETLLGF